MNDKNYIKPVLVEMGNVTELTQFGGSTNTQDTIYSSLGQVIATGLGSVNYGGATPI